ncbi:hypothetical protein [Bacillus sp. FDAARGOS_1420]|uniref:hypothetical protein n=1 Tax=unclassified Bacillus (in: firmicutes) TaxID=185979 RepID=UPI00214AD677|nr:hypothetical protein [Bacillus sp. FDAARGOS_1420]
MKVILKIIFAGFLLCLLCACAERREIEELGFVVGAAYDQSSHAAIKENRHIKQRHFWRWYTKLDTKLRKVIQFMSRKVYDRQFKMAAV